MTSINPTGIKRFSRRLYRQIFRENLNFPMIKDCTNFVRQVIQNAEEHDKCSWWETDLGKDLTLSIRAKLYLSRDEIHKVINTRIISIADIIIYDVDFLHEIISYEFIKTVMNKRFYTSLIKELRDNGHISCPCFTIFTELSIFVKENKIKIRHIDRKRNLYEHKKKSQEIYEKIQNEEIKIGINTKPKKNKPKTLKDKILRRKIQPKSNIVWNEDTFRQFLIDQRELYILDLMALYSIYTMDEYHKKLNMARNYFGMPYDEYDDYWHTKIKK